MNSNEPTERDSVYKVINFLKTNVPQSSIPNIESELKKDFVFAKKKNRMIKKKTKKKKPYLNRKEKKMIGFYNLAQCNLKYSDVLPLYNVWKDYICKVLEIEFKNLPHVTSKQWETLTQGLYKSDFHGSILKVIRSKCPSYVGKTGICILDTRNCFKILTKDNIVNTIPKKECVFEIFINNICLKLFGKQLCVRPAERSTKKIKAQQHPDI